MLALYKKTLHLGIKIRKELHLLLNIYTMMVVGNSAVSKILSATSCQHAAIQIHCSYLCLL